MLDYGEVVLETASENGTLVFPFIAHPEGFRNQLWGQGSHAGPLSAPTAAPAASARDRLAELEKLRQAGLVTEAVMRAATYTIPAAPGDTEPGECGVYYFGKGQGGDADANITRWAGQFEGGPKPVRSTKSVSGMTIQLVEISGTYLAPSGPMMQSQGKKPGYRLLGAIVPVPEGSIFFKLTGPSKTVASARPDFDALLASLKKQPAATNM